MANAGEQHQPIRVYLMVWGALFVLSVFSYLMDYLEVRPLGLKWFLITALALVKAGLIVAYFMHMRFERQSLVFAILLPPVLLLALVAILMPEGAYVAAVRQFFLGN
ncbi:cytochrome C oxidase subunit IV family protein [Marinithermus hydrothermalis]|uniref:Cytochrome c oxidase, subunit IV n=1 Tax=Marinithermus hydrothermalis (strain DSM 14884 / JCM 11576 / T1) TaxID=869210 RepID=F2NMV3_MARHT|nr:cytochrome C oxidase subunit IV family protein [Marinithermus hydrothermalis]AEB12692.1 cytochrome c oxidase, subunit IV [Marinithermus hydrothermalis DSM 14884]